MTRVHHRRYRRCSAAWVYIRLGMFLYQSCSIFGRSVRRCTNLMYMWLALAGRNCLADGSRRHFIDTGDRQHGAGGLRRLLDVAQCSGGLQRDPVRAALRVRDAAFKNLPGSFGRLRRGIPWSDGLASSSSVLASRRCPGWRCLLIFLRRPIAELPKTRHSAPRRLGARDPVSPAKNIAVSGAAIDPEGSTTRCGCCPRNRGPGPRPPRRPRPTSLPAHRRHR